MNELENDFTENDVGNLNNHERVIYILEKILEDAKKNNTCEAIYIAIHKQNHLVSSACSGEQEDILLGVMQSLLNGNFNRELVKRFAQMIIEKSRLN